MTIEEYKYKIDECDVLENQQRKLKAYREFRYACLSSLCGDSNTSVKSQLHSLAWHTAIYRTLNEARRLESHRQLNGPMWAMMTTGYLHLLMLGIRRLTDKDRDTDSLWSIITRIENRPELLTREMYVCYDGLPFDCGTARDDYLASFDWAKGEKPPFFPLTGPQAWDVSEKLHSTFDRLAIVKSKRERSDTIRLEILSQLKSQLEHPSIKDIRTIVNNLIAHSVRQSANSDAIPSLKLNIIDEAFGQLIRVANFLSTTIFYSTNIGNIVPTPQFNVLEALDEPWVLAKNLPTLHQTWDEICSSMDKWIMSPCDDFLMP